MSTPTTKYSAAELQERILQVLQAGPARNMEIVEAIYPGKGAAMDNGQATSEYARVSSTLRALRDRKLLVNVDPSNRNSGWKLRAKPTVHDLPDSEDARPKGRPKGSKNGSGKFGQRDTQLVEATLVRYLVKEIRMKLDELERLL